MKQVTSLTKSLTIQIHHDHHSHHHCYRFHRCSGGISSVKTQFILILFPFLTSSSCCGDKWQHLAGRLVGWLDTSLLFNLHCYNCYKCYKCYNSYILTMLQCYNVTILQCYTVDCTVSSVYCVSI